MEVSVYFDHGTYNFDAYTVYLRYIQYRMQVWQRTLFCLYWAIKTQNMDGEQILHFVYPLNSDSVGGRCPCPY